MRDADVYVINRENVKWLVDLHGKKWPFDMIVVDESSSFKNPSSQRFKALKKILPFTNYMVLLTGTPSPNSLMDLWPQIYLADFGERLGRTVTGFRQRFFEQDFSGYKWKIRDGCADKIHDLISDKVIYMGAEDYLSLPDRIDLEVLVDMPDRARASYRELEKTLLSQIESGEEVEAITAAVLANKLLQFSNGAAYHDEHKNWAEIHTAKLDAMQDLVDENPNDNLLVSYNYRFDLDRLLAKFPQAVVLDKEQSTVDRWNKGEIKMLLAHPASAGHGLNLQHGGSMIVWFGLNWSLELYQQFNGRLHRQGQTKPVRIVHIVCKDTIDQRVLGALSDKNATQSSLLKSLKV
jgi:SNF2 family DNA or RNA helicase